MLGKGWQEKERVFLFFFVGFGSIKEDYFEIARYVMQRLGETGEKIPAGIQLIMKIFYNFSSDRIIKIDQDISTEDDILRGKMGILIFIQEIDIGEFYQLFNIIFDRESIIVRIEIFVEILIRNILNRPFVVDTFFGEFQSSVADIGGEDSDIKTGCIKLEICQ